jgi:hypothetical protein
MNLEASKKTPVPGGNFAALVAGLMPKTKAQAGMSANPEQPAQSVSGPETSSGSESAVATADFLRRQRERLSGGFRDEQTGEISGREDSLRGGERPE